MSLITEFRNQYHRDVCQTAVFLKKSDIPSIADVGSPLSIKLSQLILEQIKQPVSEQRISGQTSGKNFEEATRSFLQKSFAILAHLRPGDWQFSVQGNISTFEQYKHLAEIDRLVKQNPDLRTAIGDYLVKPDVVIAKMPISDAAINDKQEVVRDGAEPRLTPVRQANSTEPTPILHASISCKLTLRSDRSQNARTEGLNLIRNRKGHTPHIAVVTAEPLPSRISSLALGTGDIDCVYHFALDELLHAAKVVNNESVSEMLAIMLGGLRLRDIADLPFDLIA